MPNVATCVSSVQNDAETVAFLIGIIVTHFPYAVAAASLVTDAARDLFAHLVQVYRDKRPEYLRGMVERRYRRRG